MKIKSIKADAEKVVRGAWMSTGYVDSEGNELRFRVRRWSNTKLAEFARQHVDKEWSGEERGFAFIGAVLITECENLEDNDGNPITWSPEFGLEFFSDVRSVGGDDDDEDGAEQVRTLEHIADAVVAFSRSDEAYIGDLSGN